MNNSIEDIIGYKFDLIKIILRNKSMNKKEFEEIKEKLILVDKLNKSYSNNEKFNLDEARQVKEYLENNSKKRR